MQPKRKQNLQGLTLREWQDLYRGGLDPADALRSLRLQADDPAWISRIDEARLTPQLDSLTARLREVNGDLNGLPLYGIPFAVKDNIDVAGWPTTAACPAFEYTAEADATVIERLRALGAVVVGKCNMDQFATGLVGTRSPYGAVPNAFQREYISGGSSSGSASVVARGLVPFALGTDTAGSGRVPAGMNNIVGLKPTRGWLSCKGVVPACRTLDCISVLALTVDDAACVASIAGGFDEHDPYSRRVSADAPLAFPQQPRVAVPKDPEFFGDAEAAQAFARAVALAQELGADVVPVDFTPFAQMASLLYEGPWTAERFTALESLWSSPDAIDPVVRSVIGRCEKFSAVDVFRFEYRRAELARAIERTMRSVDALMVPTVPAVYTIEQVANDPVRLNARLGYYTNFANFADLCALSVPAGMRTDGLPTGVTVLALAWHDRALQSFANRWAAHTCERRVNERLGVFAREGDTHAPVYPQDDSGILLAVVGAHLRGMPLNHQLTCRGAAFVQETATAPEYRLYALSGSVPAKPGLVRVSPGQSGRSVVVELWKIPAEAFGRFTAEVPPPLGIGNLKLKDGSVVKGFVCEPYTIPGAQDITEFGGWRAYLAGAHKPSPTLA